MISESHTQRMTLMFVDIPTIGAIREAQGEEAARDCQQKCLNLLGEVRRNFAGNLVRSIGGTMLCSFVEGGDAVDAAVGMQECLVASGLAAEGIAIRIGMHCGSVTIRGGNYSGEVVTTAARMITLAKPGCVVATDSVREESGERLEDRFVPLVGDAAERLNLKLFEVRWRDLEDGGAENDGSPAADRAGNREPRGQARQQRSRHTAKGLRVRHVALREVEVSEPSRPEDLLAAPADATAAPAAAPAPAGPAAPTAPVRLAPGSKLCLIWQERVLVVDKDNSLTVGRDEECDIVLKGTTASRRHAEICFRDGFFVLVDNSSNGTFIYDSKGQEFFLRQGATVLGESGAICPGAPQEEPGCEAMLYWMAG